MQFLRRRPLAARSFPVRAGRTALAPFLLLKHHVDGLPNPEALRNREGAARAAGRGSA